ncbi:MAG: hypothetical protein SFY81_00585 [Verrucomicrobiota bacterium]|nr:hypothetical protein [Verrucomicrobiota bacterium]
MGLKVGGVRQRIHIIFTAWLLIVSIGGRWELLQTAAWTGMLISFTKTDSFAVAVEKTFKGDRPCQLCKIVKEGRESEREQEQSVEQVKIDWMLVQVSHVVWPSREFSAHLSYSEPHDLFFNFPETPPPRFV